MLVSITAAARGQTSASPTAPTTQAAAPETENPALKRLSTAITFYASYDHGVSADLSSDKPDPFSVDGKVEFHPGLYGKSVLAIAEGHTYICYKTEDVDLTKPGACSIWLAPYQWVRSDKEDYFWPVKIMGNNAQLLFGRMGHQPHPNMRDDMTYLWAQVGQHSGVTIRGGSSLQWKNGEWHLWVMNWRGNSVEFSIDGGELGRQSLPSQLDTTGKKGAGMFVAHHVPGGEYLLDDLIIFNRPLANDEVKWMYDEGMKRAALLPPATTPITQP